jgi:hypothetical protein
MQGPDGCDRQQVTFIAHFNAGFFRQLMFGQAHLFFISFSGKKITFKIIKK